LNLTNPNGTESINDQHLYLIDAFRTPIAQLFELNQFIRNFRTENHSSSTQKSLIGDLCVHVGELDEYTNKEEQNSNQSDETNDEDEKAKSEKKEKNSNNFNSHYLPEFNCLYLSPANFWFNDYSLFKQEDDLIKTMNFDPYKKSVPSDDQTGEPLSPIKSILNQILSFSTKNILSKSKLTNLKELLFGVSWQSTLTSLNENLNLTKLLNKHSKSKSSNSSKSAIVLTYAITIALKKYDRSFLDELKQKLELKFNQENRKSSLDLESNQPWVIHY
jgi:hypothetical protein